MADIFTDVFTDIFGGTTVVAEQAGQILTRGLLMGPGTKFLVSFDAPHDGLGSLAPRASVTPRPRQHGSRPIKQYQPERLLRWTMHALGDSPEDTMALIEQVGAAWAPLEDGSQVTMSIRYANDRAYLYLGQPSRTAVDMTLVPQSYASIACEWLALDPRAYDSNAISAETALSVSASGQQFPFGFPMGFGSAFGRVATSNAGNIGVPWVAVISGGVSGLVNPSLGLGSSGETLQFIITLAAGQQLFIDSREKSVLLNNQADRSTVINRPSAATWFDIPPGSDLVTFGGSGDGTLDLTYRSGWNL